MKIKQDKSAKQSGQSPTSTNA